MVGNEAMRPGAVQDSMSSDPDVSIRAYRELIVTNLIPELQKITRAGHGPVRPAEERAAAGRAVRRVYKGGYSPVLNLTLKRIPDSAHFIMWDQPQRFRTEAAAFLSAK